MNVDINGYTLKINLVDNSSTQALVELLSKGPLTLQMDDYGSMEKVGSLGHQLPRNDRNITTKTGDVILYQGHNLVIYYEPNTWSFTKLGEVEGLDAVELQHQLGTGPMNVTLSRA